MAYLQDSLSANETIEAEFRPHWTAWSWVALWTLLGLPTLGIGFLIALYLGLSLWALEFGVTNKRVVFKSGIISRKTQEMKLRSIETVEIRQGIVQRLLGAGTVIVTGKGVSDVVFRNIDDPMAVKRRIESVDAVD